MSTGILINARLGSTRLKKKHILKVNEKEIILYLLERISNQFQLEIEKNLVEIVIATSEEEENKIFEVVAGDFAKVFYGNKDNIPLRQLQASEYYNFDNLISVDGDDIFCSPEAMRLCCEQLLSGEQYVRTIGLPFGMNVFAYSKKFLENSILSSSNKVLETGWGRILQKSKAKEIEYKQYDENLDLRFTLDYENDFIFFERIIKNFPGTLSQAPTDKIIEYALKEDLYLLNSNLSQQYWENFNMNLNKENA